jgi:hypothetical protein
MCVLALYAQDVKVLTDKQTILIGEPFMMNISVQTEVAGSMELVLDSIPHFEILDRGTAVIKKAGTKGWEQTLILTSFDSGLWMIPALPVKLIKDGQELRLSTPVIQVMVTYDTTENAEIHDIKEWVEQEKWWSWWHVLLAILTLVLILWLIFRLFKKKQEPVVTMKKMTPDEAYHHTLKAIEQLDPNNITAKKYYTILTDATKKYIEDGIGYACAHKTTDELLLWFSGFNNEHWMKSFSTLFRTSDAVKFAKYEPPMQQRLESKDKLIILIKEIHQTQPS